MFYIPNEVRDAVFRHHMIEEGDRVILGVSGGADSTALLHILSFLSGILKAEYRAVHVHHGIRGQEADRDARDVEELCRTYQIPCKVVYVQAMAFAKKNKLSPEEAGRALRYSVFEEEAKSWEAEGKGKKKVKIAVAHNKEDNAETILMQLSRGSGLRGVAGMRPVRGRIIRPLLGVSRKDIEAYLKKEAIGWCTDSTNLQDVYTRNRIRHEILPKLAEAVNSAAVENITRAGCLIGEADAYLEKQAESFLSKSVLKKADGIGISQKALDLREPIIRLYMLRRMIEMMSQGGKDITAKHIEDLNRLADSETGKKLHLPRGLEAQKTYGMLWIGKSGFFEARREDAARTKEMIENCFDFSVFPYTADMEIPFGTSVKWFDYDKITGEPEIRTRRAGDYIVLKGGGRKSIKSLMTDEKIAVSKRDQIPLLSIGSDVLWVFGSRISEKYKVDAGTRRVLEVRYRGE